MTQQLNTAMALFDRRQLMVGMGAALGATLGGCNRAGPDAPPPADPADAGSVPGTVRLPFANGDRPLVQLPGKRPLIQLTSRPPQLETPFALFDDGLITPNDAFFVRYSMAQLPLDLDMKTWRLDVEGHVQRPLALSMAALQALPQTSLVAVNQCSGNSRGFSSPRVGGGQMGHGAMGNAKWTGVSLKAVLDAAGIRRGAVEIAFDGMDSPAMPQSPDFAKSLSVDHARDGTVMLAWAMNDEALPFLNGFPLRLVVPGWFGTYWVKHLNRITVLDTPFDGYFMKKTYRMPDNECGCVAPGTKPDDTRPITAYRVRSFITSHSDGATVAAGRPFEVRGFAFDGGSGIRRVMVSTNGGKAWEGAALGEQSSPYAFRGWRHRVTLPAGNHQLLARAETMAGEIQPLEASWNPSGYARNVIEPVGVIAA